MGQWLLFEKESISVLQTPMKSQFEGLKLCMLGKCACLFISRWLFQGKGSRADPGILDGGSYLQSEIRFVNFTSLFIIFPDLLKIRHENEIVLSRVGGGGSSEPLEPPLHPLLRFSKRHFWNTIRVSNNLDTDQAR